MPTAMDRITVFGGIALEDGSEPTEPLIIRAYDKDMVGEELLGEDGPVRNKYSIKYSSDRFQTAERKTADIIVKAFTEAEELLAESDVHYNVETRQRIDLVITARQVPEEPRLSELEQLQASIEDLRQNVDCRRFSDRQVTHLTEETIRRGIVGDLTRRTVHQHLEFLRLAAQFEYDTEIVLAAFYGWFRMDQPARIATLLDGEAQRVLDELLDVSLSILRRAIEDAIARNIIPDITGQIPEILERIRALRFERGRLVSHQFVAQLIDDETEQPLVGYLVEVVDTEAEPEDQTLGSLSTDGRGVLVLMFSLPADAPEDAVRRLQLAVSDDGVVVAETELEARARQEEVAQIRVQLREDDRGEQPIEGIASVALSSRLRLRGINTLRDLLNDPDLEDEDHAEELERLRGHAKFAVLAPDLGEDGRQLLIDEGYRSLLDIAKKSRAEFVREHHERLNGDAVAYAIYAAARKTGVLYQHMLNTAWFDTVTTPDDEPDDPDIPTGVGETLKPFKKCGCKDCDSAVSPSAYLAHLLQWTLEHVKDVEDPITLAALNRTDDQFGFGQPFAKLPADCEAVEERVRQVRICVEVLWRFTGFLNLSDLQMPTSFRNSYRHLRNQLYRAILTNLGVSFEQMRKSTLAVEGDSLAAQNVAEQRQAVASLLGVDESHIVADIDEGLFFDIEQPGISPSENDLERLFGFRNTRISDDAIVSTANPLSLLIPPPQPRLVDWQREGLETIWQQQDWTLDAYSGDERLPLVDPVLIDESYLRIPLDENPAFPLLEARREALDAHRQSLIDANPQQNGLSELLTDELGQPIGQLRSLYESLQTSDQPEEAEQSLETINSLNLTTAGFSHLMGIDGRLQAGEAVASSEAEIDNAWEAVFDILSRTHRHALFPTWVEEENSLEIRLGARLFWIPATAAEPTNPLQATVAERSAWEEALHRRNRRSIIDPDQITTSYLTIHVFFLATDATNPPQTPLQLWERRREWIDGRLAALEQARQGLASSSQMLQAMLAASALSIDNGLLSELANLEADGIDIQPRLAQLNLPTSGYRFLADIHLLTEGDAAVSADKWEALEGVLVQTEKQLEYAEWHVEEQEMGITLHPHRFQIPEREPSFDESPHAHWLHDTSALQLWKDTLSARSDQLQAMTEALDKAVDTASVIVLPLLRNILIMQAAVPDNVSNLIERAEWLDKRLLIDMQMDGCHMTTRISQAIETLQRLIRGIYAKEHIKPLRHLTLDAEEDYEAEWPVIGSYYTWRAFMLAYLYPENLLHISPPPVQSFGFERLKKKIPSRVTPTDACEAANEYADYFRDICHLEVQASCQVETRMVQEGDCEGLASASRSRVHLFALATTSGRVYTNSYDGFLHTEDTLDTWRPIKKLTNVIEIIGAVPHQTPKQQRLILVFAKVRQESRNRLVFVSVDLDGDTGSWSKAIKLSLPPGTGFDFSVVAVQKRHGGDQGGLSLAFGDASAGSASQKRVPTILAIRTPNGRVYVRSINDSATRWDADEWIPLFGPIRSKDISKVCALIQRSSHEYLMIVQTHDRRLNYRIFSVDSAVSKDDGWWRLIAKGEFAGALFWPNTNDIFVFYQTEAKTKYAIIGDLNNIDSNGYSVDSIQKLNQWLRSVAGIDLADFPLSLKVTVPFPEWPLKLAGGEFSFEDKNVEIPYQGNLLALLLLTKETWDWMHPDLGEARAVSFISTNDLRNKYLSWGLQKIKAEAIELIGKAVTKSRSPMFSNAELTWLKLADNYVRQFSGGNVLANFIFNLGTFSYRGFQTESQKAGSLFSNLITVISTGGDEDFGPSPNKYIVFNRPSGDFRLKLSRLENTLNKSSIIPVTLNAEKTFESGTGPLDMLPLSSKGDLKLRRTEIHAFYKGLPAKTPRSIKQYLKEAYNLIPICLGYKLHKTGYFEEALLWYRQVFDYLQPSGKRKIDHSLRLEQKLKLGFDDAAEWLDDSSNAHAIAATRKNTYTRHILLLIIRCLIEYANALFSNDNVTDNARARELYTLAIRFIDFEVLKPGKSKCADIIGELEVEVVEPGQLPLKQYSVVLNRIQDPDQLDELIQTLSTISQDTGRPLDQRATDMREVVSTALESVPAAKRMSTVLDTKEQTARAAETYFLADKPARTLLKKNFQRRKQSDLMKVAEIARVSEDILIAEPVELAWLRLARPQGEEDEETERLPEISSFEPDASHLLATLAHVRGTLPMASLIATQNNGFGIQNGVFFDFCIPQNPVIQSLRTQAETNLFKLRTCRNIAGFVRSLDPYGAPIGLGSGIISADGTIFSGIVEAPPTIYRYAALIARAKELVNITQQIESGYQLNLEKAESEALSVLQAEQSVELAVARVTLQDLGLTRASDELGLVQKQKESAVLRQSKYNEWIAAGQNKYEIDMLQSYSDATEAQKNATISNAAVTQAQFAAQSIGAWQGTKTITGIAAAQNVALVVASAAAFAESNFRAKAIDAENAAQTASFLSSFERRNDEWQLQAGLAALDVQIGDQQIQLAQDGYEIAEQERVIAGLEQTHAADTLQFLVSKFFSEEIYRWIASVLEDVYRFFLQEASSIAKLAERQLAFERQQAPLRLIQSNYWNISTKGSGTRSADNIDRLGLTGSARLLKDIYQLDQYAFETRQRKQALQMTLDLAELLPVEFQRFRETGVLVFETPLSLIDRQMPGYYLCLIQQVNVSVVALIPPTYGIRATLTSAGTSRAVVGGDTFQTVTIRNLPERIALTASRTTSSIIDLEPDAPSLLNPYEGSGFDTLWEIRMPKASNPWDYNTMATVLFTVNLTALHSYDYERQVIESLDRTISFNRAFDFRQVFADPWYDLNNPDQTDTPMRVRFDTRREDFPPNLNRLAIQHVVLYVVRKDGELFEQEVQHLHFTSEGTSGVVGGPAVTVDGRVSTRSGNGTNWLPMIGLPPYGDWELAFSDGPPSDIVARSRFAEEQIENLLLVITVSGETATYVV